MTDRPPMTQEQVEDHIYAKCRRFLQSDELQVITDLVNNYAEEAIAAFLEQTGQYVTNDASREAAIEAAIKQEREAANRDAERYRIVREGRSWEFMVNCVPDGRQTFTPEGLDDACDRAIRARSEPHPPWCSGGCCERSEDAK